MQSNGTVLPLFTCKLEEEVLLELVLDKTFLEDTL